MNVGSVFLRVRMRVSGQPGGLLTTHSHRVFLVSRRAGGREDRRAGGRGADGDRKAWGEHRVLFSCTLV